MLKVVNFWLESAHYSTLLGLIPLLILKSKPLFLQYFNVQILNPLEKHKGLTPRQIFVQGCGINCQVMSCPCTQHHLHYKMHFIAYKFLSIQQREVYSSLIVNLPYLHGYDKVSLNKVWRFSGSYSIFTKCWGQVFHG